MRLRVVVPERGTGTCDTAGRDQTATGDQNGSVRIGDTELGGDVRVAVDVRADLVLAEATGSVLRRKTSPSSYCGSVTTLMYPSVTTTALEAPVTGAPHELTRTRRSTVPCAAGPQYAGMLTSYVAVLGRSTSTAK